MSTPGPESADLLENAPCGYLVTDGAGTVVRANAEALRIIGRTRDDVLGTRTFASLLSVGGRIYAETHLLPVLEHDKTVREVALEILRPDGTRSPVLLNANRINPEAHDAALRIVLIETRDRRRFEEDLLRATHEAEDARNHAAALAETLQRTLIPPTPPRIPHLDLAAAYRPAGSGREVGGDFYDVVKTGPVTWLVVLGDVSGKGIPAATLTSFVRHTVRSLALDHPDPADLLAELDLAMRQHPTDRYCTLAVAHLTHHADRWDVALSLAGHPAAILRSPSGEVVELGVPGTPVGLVEHPHFHTVRHRLAGQVLTLYTDGVTEARGETDMYGEERLRDLIASLPHDAQAITDGVTRAALDFQGGITADDIAVVSVAAT